MQIDIHFLVFLSGLITVIIFIVLSLQYFLVREKNREGFVWWTLASFFNTFGMAFTFVREVPALFNIAIIGNNLFFIVGVICFYIGTKKNFDKYSLKLWHIFYCIVFIGIISYFTFVKENMEMRVVANSAFIGFIDFLIAKTFCRCNKKLKCISSKFLAVMFMIYGVFSTFRAFYYLNVGNEAMFTPSNMQITTYLIYIVVNIFVTFGFIINLNQRLNEENMEARKNLETIFNTTPDAVTITNFINGTIFAVNDGFVEQSGYESEELVGKSMVDVKIWKDMADRQNFLEKIMKQGYVDNMEAVFYRKDRTELTGLVSAKLIKLDGVEHIISVTRNITERKDIEYKLKENEHFLAELIENNGALIYVKDEEGRYKLVNKKWEDTVGLKRDMVMGRKDMDLFPGEVGESYRNADIDVIKAGKVEEIEEIFKDSSGTRHFISVKFPTKDKDNNINGVCGLSTEITDRKQREEEIRKLAEQLEIERNYARMSSITDGLTGIYNRRHFDETFRKEFYSLKRTGVPMSFIILDIDYFKKYNDRYGHLAGDECLKKVAATLKEVVNRATDTVARYGGEEFVAILPATNEKGALKIAEKIREAVENLEIPHETSLAAGNVTISLGVTTAYKAIAISPEQIIALADEALYKAKNSGRNRVEKANVEFLMHDEKSGFIQLIWNKSDESGNVQIDEQHKKLLVVSNRLLAAINRNVEKDDCLKIIYELIEDVRVHFKEEEDIINKTKYPHCDAHHDCHLELLQKVDAILEKFIKDELNMEELILFLAYDMVAQHLEVEDKTFFPYLAEETAEITEVKK